MKNESTQLISMFELLLSGCNFCILYEQNMLQTQECSLGVFADTESQKMMLNLFRRCMNRIMSKLRMG